MAITSNLRGLNCKIYPYTFTDVPDGTSYNKRLMQTIIDNGTPFDYFLAIPETTTEKVDTMPSQAYLYNAPTVPATPSMLNSETVALFDTNLNGWQLESLFYYVSSEYTGTVNVSECIGMFRNAMNINMYIDDPDFRGFVIYFPDVEFAYSLRRDSPNSKVLSSDPHLYDLIGNSQAQTQLFSEIYFVSGTGCHTVQTGYIYGQNKFFRYDTSQSGYTSMRNTVLYGNKSNGNTIPEYFFRSLTKDFVPPSSGGGGEDGDDPYGGIDGMGEISGGGSGVVGVPGFPGLTATGAGVIGLFAPSAAQMQALSDYMWTDFGGTGTTTDEILGEIVQALKRSISNPLDYVVGLNIIPSQGLSIGGSSTIRFGFTSSGVSMPRLSNQYFAVNCGSLSFSPVCGNTFLDYAPYSKFSIYLPYIGVKEVDANDFVGHTIGVTYHGDVVTGGVTAYVTKDGSVMYQYSGCCALNVPLSADGWGSTIAGAVQIATSMVAAFGGGAAGVATAAAEGAASVAANPSLLSPQVSHSGAVSGGAGCMGVQYPFVIRETVRFHSTSHFNQLSGYPSFYYRLLDNVEGYTKVLDVHLNSIPGTAEEVAEIETLLKRGVIL